MGIKVVKPPIMDTTIVNSFVQRPLFCKEELWIGRQRHIHQALLQFDVSVLPFFLTILHATLNIYIYENDFPTVSKTLEAYQILSEWNEKKVIFDDQPLIAPTPAASTTFTSDEDAFLSFDLTALLTNWHNGSAANFGVLLKMQNEVIPSMIGIRSKDFANSQLWPDLEINYIDSGYPGGGCCEILSFDVSVITSSVPQPAAVLNTQLFNYTYFVINTGINPASVRLEISPDGANWQVDQPLQTVLPGEMVSLVPNVLATYTRLVYQSTNPGQDTGLDIRVRGRS